VKFFTKSDKPVSVPPWFRALAAAPDGGARAFTAFVASNSAASGSHGAGAGGAAGAGGGGASGAS